MNRFLHIVCALTLLVLGGCKDNTRPRPRPNAGTGQATSVTGIEPAALVTNITTGTGGGELHLPLVGEPRTFNPLTAHDPASETITRLLFSGLTRFNWKTETAEPDLAHAWSVAKDGRTWTWHLRRNLQWSDGRPLTANDVVFTWNQIIYSPHFINPLAATFAIGGEKFKVSKLDDRTVQFVTPRPFAAFVTFVGNVPVLPRHAVRSHVAERRFAELYGIGTPTFRLIGSGPYRLNRYVPGEGVQLERNELYHRSDANGQRLPYLNIIRFHSVPTPDDLPHRFLTNELALAEGLRFEDLAILNRAAQTNHLQVLDLGAAAEPRLLWFNQNPTAEGVDAHKLAWFREARFRRAISLAIDRPAIVDDVFGGKATLPAGFLLPGSTRWRADAIGFPHDRTESLKLLAESGFQPGKPMRDAEGRPVGFTLKLARGSTTSSAVAETIRTQLGALGMQVTLEHVEFPALLHSLEVKFDYDAILMGLGGAMPDPETAGDILRSAGAMHFWYPRQTAPATPWERQIDDLFARQRGELDFETRKATCDEIQQILAREAPFLPLFLRHGLAATRLNLGNLKPVATAPFPLTWNLDELYLR